MNDPIAVHTNPDETVAVMTIPLEGSGTDETSIGGLETLREELVPRLREGPAGGDSGAR